jgi:hypothetical protein
MKKGFNLISYAIILNYEISKRISCSLKTESKRLANIKKKNIQIFFVATDPLKMTGYLRIGIFIQLNKNFHHKTLIIQKT